MDHEDCHVSYFMVPLSVLGLALPWALLSETTGISNHVWQVKRAPGTDAGPTDVM